MRSDDAATHPTTLFLVVTCTFFLVTTFVMDAVGGGLTEKGFGCHVDHVWRAVIC